MNIHVYTDLHDQFLQKYYHKEFAINLFSSQIGWLSLARHSTTIVVIFQGLAWFQVLK